MPADFHYALRELFVALSEADKRAMALCIGDAIRDLADFFTAA